MKTEIEILKNEIALKDKHIDVMASALSEIKATHEGKSGQTIENILNGCIAEIRDINKQNNS